LSWEDAAAEPYREGIVGYQQRSDHEAGALQDCLPAITRISPYFTVDPALFIGGSFLHG
jgi:hypothetical protein